MTHDKPLIVTLLMLVFCVLALIGDALGKIPGPIVLLTLLIFMPFAVQALVLIHLVYLGKRQWRMDKRIRAFSTIRIVLLIAAIVVMINAFKFLPLADTIAIAIAFVIPFMLLLLGKLFMNDKVGPQRVFTCLAGFLGTLLVIQPSFREAGAAAFLPVLTAVLTSFFILITRHTAKKTDPIGL
jgi:drug/metabolite transporter (DMT)-like permease